MIRGDTFNVPRPPRKRGSRAIREWLHNKLFPYLLSNHIIADGLVEETLNGKYIKKPLARPTRQQFEFEIDEDTSVPKLYIYPGTVYAPWTSDTTVNVPRVHFMATEPTIVNDSIWLTGTERPFINLTSDSDNYIFLTLTFTSYDYKEGGVDYDGAGEWGYECPFSLEADNSGAKYPVDDATPQADPPPIGYGIRHYQAEQNYYLASAVFSAQLDSTYPTGELATKYEIYCGRVQLDENGSVTAQRNYIQGGPIWAHALPRPKDRSSAKGAQGRTLPEAPVTAGNAPTIPGL